MTSNDLKIQTIYAYNSHTNIPWNICEYEPTRQYLDPQKIKQYNQAKDKNFKRQAKQDSTKKSQKIFFLDEVIKPTLQNPSPNKYKTLSIFDQKINRQKSKSIKINPRLKKHTYLQFIQSNFKRHKIPSVGKYHLEKTQKQLKEQLQGIIRQSKKRRFDEKRHFYDEAQTNDVPGAGIYNPHLSIQKQYKQSRKDYKFWVDKHRTISLSQTKKKSKQPAPTSYRPISASFNSFDRIQQQFIKEQKKKKGNKEKPRVGFTSSDTKFEYTRESKVKVKEQRPSMTKYETRIQWKGKNQDAKKNNWVRCVSAGPTRSVYH